MNNLNSQTTEHLLILLKAILEFPYNSLYEERSSIVSEIIEIMSRRI